MEAGNYAAYQRAYASRYGQLDGLSYPSNPLMMAGGSHPLLAPPPPPQTNVQSPALDSYYQALQSGLSGMPNPYGNMFSAHRPMPFHSMPSQNGFLPPNPFYPLATMAQQNAEHRERAHSISPAASQSSTHSPITHPQTRQISPVQAPTDDNESDIEV